jgi:hypothetical protein
MTSGSGPVAAVSLWRRPDRGRTGCLPKAAARRPGRLVTVIIEDTRYRILRGEAGFAVKPDRGAIVLAVLGVLGPQVRESPAAAALVP